MAQIAAMTRAAADVRRALLRPCAPKASAPRHTAATVRAADITMQAATDRANAAQKTTVLRDSLPPIMRGAKAKSAAPAQTHTAYVSAPAFCVTVTKL